MSKPTTWQFNVMLTNKAKWFLKFDNYDLVMSSCHDKDTDR